MSLFGDETDAPTPRTKSSLFDDNSKQSTKAGSSMFGDDGPAQDDSPWGFTPKKNAGRGNLVKSLLADADVPDYYIDTFDGLQAGGSVQSGDCRQLLQDAKIDAGDQDKIWNLVSSNGASTRLGRSEFNVLLALIGLAQEGEELGLDAVDDRRRRLPKPKLPSSARQLPTSPEKATRQEAQPTPSKQNGTPKPTFGADFPDGDPWGSPQMHKGHNHTNGIGSAQPERTTSAFTTASAADATGGDAGGSASFTGNDSNTWGASSAGGFGNTTTTSEYGASSTSGGFGGEDNTPRQPRRAAPPRNVTSHGQEELVTVNLLDEKEGMFLFQHRNYEVASVRRASKVVRRYSDFVWLLDCLHKRYPFRQLPLLPPKRVAINGNHLAADATFLEKRRRGLARFSNALVRHPILREEQLVVMFLTVPTELAVWRKQATLNVQEEFTGKALPPTLEDSLPRDLVDTFDTVRTGVRRSAELYINLCTLTERLCKRKEGIAAEYGRFSMNLGSITETTATTFAIDTNDVPLLNEGLRSTAKYINTSQSLLEDESRAWDEGLLEDFKTIRDAMVSMRDMFDRRDRYAKDNILQLEKKIQQNEQKLQSIKAKGPAAKVGEAEKVENAIVNDKQSIVDQHARGVFIKECIRDEINFFQMTISRISRLHQDWAQERVKYAELQADNFRGLVDAVEGMPLGE